MKAEEVIQEVARLCRSFQAKEDEALLASCYRECLKLAADQGVELIAFCCISTGVFRFPQQRAVEVAVATVKEFMKKDDNVKKVVFNVFKEENLRIYKDLLKN